MKAVLHRIVNLGIEEDTHFSLRNKLKVFNTAVLAILLISIFYGVAGFIAGFYVAVVVTAYSALSNLIMFWLVKKGRHVFAFHYAMFYAFVFLTSFSLLFGAATNSYYYFLFLPIACNIFFNSQRVIVVYFIMCTLFMLFNVILTEQTKPYYEVDAVTRMLGYPNIPFVMILVFLAVSMFKKENRKYAEKIEMQKAALEEKNKEITDSINYAKRIQAALLAPASLLKKNLPEHFVLYKPKAIVSGDFYWATESVGSGSETFWLCVGDCTGHGVPGAFMSLMNISILRELIVEQKNSTPDVVLNKQREAIIRALNPDGAASAAKDGMDCILMNFERNLRVLHFAAANNPLLIVRNGTIVEYNADKQPVGLHEGHDAPFTLQKVELQRGDIVYAFTDGFADQFGGPRGKKFKYSQLKEHLLKLNEKTMDEQRNYLDTVFEDWRGGLEQLDDVLIIGIKVT
ncbi:MAG TPA: SpoIIE family protein phosphatase [Bacteroidia bacterium]|nr:SpoIIE family protein phosphatase [Bacteroidia bacterium]